MHETVLGYVPRLRKVKIIMKVRLLSLGVLALLATVPMPLMAHNDPVPPLDNYYTGSKIFTSDNACFACHAQGNTGNVKLTFNGAAATTYAPGATIPIQITITDTGGGRNVWGFELAARFSNSKPAGTLASSSATCPTSNPNCTFVSTLNFFSAGQPVISHRGVVPASGSTFTFTINWTAPAAGSGNVVFSAAGNAGSGNTQDQSTDHIYLTEVTLAPAASTPPPTVPSNGVVEGAGFTASISAGGIGSIFGTNLATSTA